MNRKISIIAVLLAVAGLVFWIAYAELVLTDTPKFLVGESSLANSKAKAILIVYGYATLVVGVFLGSGYRELKERRTKDIKQIKIKELLGSILHSTDFWLGLFGSPVVYAILLQAIDLNSASIASATGVTLVGLQNGFVCQSIADAIRPKIAGSPAEDPPQTQP
jgi:hypothetical protein